MFSFFVMFLALGYSQTYLNDNQDVYGIWTKSNSPYIVNGEVLVPQGKTLTIEPGVIVKFKTGSQNDRNLKGFNYGMLRVRGNIVANGTKDEPILFTKDGETGNWGIILIENSMTGNSFRYCKIEYSYSVYNAYESSAFYGGLSLYSSNAAISYCSIENTSNTAIHLSQSHPDISYCVFAKNTAAIICYESSSPTITNCTFYGNYFPMLFIGDPKIIIRNCIFWKNDNPLEISNGFATISYTLLQNSELPDKSQNNGNIIFNRDPLFVDQEGFNFSLQPGSPCIGTASDGGNMGAIASTGRTDGNTSKGNNSGSESSSKKH